MKITIQRPEQIGGQITKISTEKASIIIDLGKNLEEKDPLNNRKAVEELTNGCDAVLYTHYHGDHIGLCRHVPPTVPQYIGQVALDVKLCLTERLKETKRPETKEEARETLKSLKRMKLLYPAKTKIFGDIKVTPFFVSHSAAFAFMYLIEAEGKRILHSGDFRGHGLLSKGLMRTITKLIGHVDVLISEGTMLARSSETVDSESKLGRIAKKWMERYNYVFVLTSSTDLERLTVLNNATRSVGHHLVCDQYQKKMLDIFSSIEYNGINVFNFGEVDVFPDDERTLIATIKRDGFTMLIRSGMENYIKPIMDRIDPSQTLLIYSMWKGYVTRKDTMSENIVSMQELFKTDRFLAPILNLHTSGHATMETLREVCETLNPSTAIIPIHREKGSDFKDTNISPELQEKIVTKDCTLNGIEICFKD